MSFHMSFQKDRAFSLLELLIVIAIITIIATLLLPNLIAARQRARDTERKSDLNQLQKAFTLYQQDQTPPAFPTQFASDPTQGLGGAGLCGSPFPTTAPKSSVYMNAIPCDPLSTAANPTPYYLNVDSTGLNYKLETCLENYADPQGVTTCDINCPGAGQKCYIVTQP